MTSIEAPIGPAKAPLGPRIVELLSGDWRYVPILTAIVFIWILFDVWDPKFLSPRNLSNLSLQSVVTGILALGLVPVLIIRQIDMSVAAVSAVAGTITGQMLIVFDAPVWLAIGAGVAFGAAVGFVQGRWITWTKTPGFLITFGVSLILAAVQLRLLPATGQINLFGTDLTFLAGSYVDKLLSWALVLLAVAGFAVFRYFYVSDALKAGLPVTVLKNVVAPTAVVLVVMAIAVGALDRHNGVPVALLIFLLAIIILSYIGSHTRFGVYLYGTGANPSAVARAGIKVDRIRIVAFTICGSFAAFGGILAASRLLGVSAQSSGMGTLLLEAITAAVVGGTSLFVGRGSPWSALFGALAIARERDLL
jgi:D-xylose transport system permease protein